MKARFLFTFFGLWLVGLSCSFASDAYISVSSGQTGHGLLRQRRGNCYVILPKHVTKPAGDIVVTLPGGDTSEARLLKEDPSADLAILILTSKGLCRGSERTATESLIEAALSRSSTAVLHSTTHDGSSSRKQATIKEVTDQIVTFGVSGEDSLQQGDSGSVLSIGNVPIGMLIRVSDGSGRQGNAYKQTVIEDFWKRVMPPESDCSQGCFFEASQANLVKKYETSAADNGPVVRTVTTRYDFVYEVPEGLPLPAYFHVWQNRLESSTNLVAPVSSISTTNFSFSQELSERAADINILALGFDLTGNMPSSILLNGHAWTINITQQGGQKFLVTVKP